MAGKPLKSLREFAQDFGVSIFTLKGHVNNSHRWGYPSPLPKTKSKTNGSYYEVKPFFEWWEQTKSHRKNKR